MYSTLFTDLIAGEAGPNASSAPQASDALSRFMTLSAAALTSGQCVQLLLSGYHGEEAGLQRVQIRPVTVKGQSRWSFLYRYSTRDITKHCDATDATVQVRDLLQGGFRNAHLHTTTHELQLRLSRRGRASLHVAPVTDPASAPGAQTAPDVSHNRVKHRDVNISDPCWQDLGLASAQHAVVPAMARKWKQINKFVEIFGGALQRSTLWARSADMPVRVADFGAGKGYLTFAMAQYLQAHSRAALVQGIELRDDLVTLCNGIAQRHAVPGLSFIHGDVRSFDPGTLDVMVALHACDTATDHALHLGLRAGASLILCAPCCHKEIRPQMTADHLPRTLRPLLRHGIHLGQEAEMVTDSLRALLLEAAGYDTQVFEFVALEHTAKNKMILALRREHAPSAAQRAELHAQISELKAFYGLREQTLERLLST